MVEVACGGHGSGCPDGTSALYPNTKFLRTSMANGSGSAQPEASSSAPLLLTVEIEGQAMGFGMWLPRRSEWRGRSSRLSASSACSGAFFGCD